MGQRRGDGRRAHEIRREGEARGRWQAPSVRRGARAPYAWIVGWRNRNKCVLISLFGCGGMKTRVGLREDGLGWTLCYLLLCEIEKVSGKKGEKSAKQ